MNDGVRILLERMQTHPEEFAGDREGKWSHLIQSYRMFLDEGDWQALEKSMNALMQQRFTEKVLDKLVNPDKKLTREEKIPLGAFTVNPQEQWGATTPIAEAQKYQVEMMRVQLDAQREAAMKQTPHKTIFGKLFNYT